MFAVREEVEVLKEKIVELTGRINQLEYENTVLKASASPETLQQLTKAQQATWAFSRARHPDDEWCPSAVRGGGRCWTLAPRVMRLFFI